MINIENHSALISSIVQLVKEAKPSSELSKVDIKILPLQNQLVSYLSEYSVSKKGYMKSVKQGVEYLFFGAVKTVDCAHQDLNDITPQITQWMKASGCHVFGGISFQPLDNAKDTLWQSFGDIHLFVPFIEIVRNAQFQSVIVNYTKEHKENPSMLKKSLELFFNSQRKTSLDPCPLNTNTFHSTSDCPHYDQWVSSVDNVLEKIGAKSLEKIVLARKSSVKASEDIDSIGLVKEMMALEPNCSVFYVQQDPKNIFISVSPETLFLREGQDIECDIIAGTTQVSEQSSQDSPLIYSDKDRKEHQAVLSGIKDSLHNISDTITVDTSNPVITLKNVQHLKYSIKAKLLTHIPDLELISRLHPTPATGGTPHDKAMSMIHSIEPFNRGWYAGAVGMMCTNHSEFLVGIRSVLIQKNTLHLFSGAGIVDGSDSHKEWQELNAKAKSYQSLLV